jgi:CheY-like chemotaxis protein
VSPSDDNTDESHCGECAALGSPLQVHEGLSDLCIYEGIEVVPHILIADDEFYQRILIREALAADPALCITEAANGAEALALVQQQTLDLAILDLLMPDIGGLQVCRLMKGRPSLRAIPVIVITALPTDEHRVGARGAGADYFLTKPFDNEALLKLVQQALQRRSH